VPQHRVAVHDRHEEVGDDRGGRRRAGEVERLQAVRGRLARVPGAFEHGAQEVSVVLVVVDDQDAGHGVGLAAPGARKRARGPGGMRGLYRKLAAI